MSWLKKSVLKNLLKANRLKLRDAESDVREALNVLASLADPETGLSWDVLDRHNTTPYWRALREAIIAMAVLENSIKYVKSEPQYETGYAQFIQAYLDKRGDEALILTRLRNYKALIDWVVKPLMPKFYKALVDDDVLLDGPSLFAIPFEVEANLVRP